MKKMTSEDLFSLKHGDRVHRWDGTNFKGLYFVGFMPRSERYLIFCEGEYLTHLYIREDGGFKDAWYSGEYDSEFVGNLIIKRLEDKIETTKRIYLEE